MTWMIEQGPGNRQWSLVQAREHFVNHLQNHGLEVTNGRGRQIRCERIYANSRANLELELNRKIKCELQRASESVYEHPSADSVCLVAVTNFGVDYSRGSLF
jgi:hypothetical protein